jgi:8-oxo-dGTP pyrophosphatase MutT (NUDIX family)
MRESIAALALIQRERNGERAFLTQWNASWGCFHFLGGHKHDDESFLECVQRELEEELQLQRDLDFHVSPHPFGHTDFVAFSHAMQETTRYIMELFVVEFTRPEALRQADGEPRNRWLTLDEIMAGRTRDGLPIGNAVNRLLQQFGLIEETTSPDHKHSP